MSLISDALDSLYETVHDPAVGGELVTLVVGVKTTELYAVLEKAVLVPPSLLGLSPDQYNLAQPNPKNIDHDFSVLAADYKIDDVPITPVRGHLLKRAFGGSTKVYELMASSSNGAVWEWQDGYEKRYMIHTKFVREE